MSEIPKKFGRFSISNKQKKVDTIFWSKQSLSDDRWSGDPRSSRSKKKIQRVFFWMLAVRMDAIGRNWLILANGQKLGD